MTEKKTPAKAGEKKQGPMLRITAKRDGFRRAGRPWSGTVEVSASEFTEEQLAALKAEPMLVVEEI